VESRESEGPTAQREHTAHAFSDPLDLIYRSLSQF
jgi:hypothetical protein